LGDLGHECVGVFAPRLALADLLGKAVATRLQRLGVRLQRLALGFERLEGRDVEEGLGFLRVSSRAMTLGRSLRRRRRSSMRGILGRRGNAPRERFVHTLHGAVAAVPEVSKGSSRSEARPFFVCCSERPRW